MRSPPVQRAADAFCGGENLPGAQRLEGLFDVGAQGGDPYSGSALLAQRAVRRLDRFAGV